jgi:hypothetical protein
MLSVGTTTRLIHNEPKKGSGQFGAHAELGMNTIMPSRGSCREESANPDTARVLRLAPRHDMGKAQQVKQGDFTLHERKLIPNKSAFGFYRPHQPKKIARIMPRGASSKPAIHLA